MADRHTKVAMTPERELWACAQKMIDTHGKEARATARLRIAELRSVGDRRGVIVWDAIIARIEGLLAEPGRQPLQ